MNVFDGIAGLVVAGGLLQGLHAGLLRQVAALVGLVVGVAAGLALMDDVGVMVVRSLGVGPTVAPVVGFILVVAAVQFGLYALRTAAERLLGFFKLTFADRLAGGLVGAAKAALVLSVLLVAGARLGVPGEATRAQSFLYTPLVHFAPAFWDKTARHLPRIGGLREGFDAATERVRARLRQPAATP